MRVSGGRRATERRYVEWTALAALGCLLPAATTSCRSCRPATESADARVHPDVADVPKVASTTEGTRDAGPALSIDATPYRERAHVPAIAYAAFAKERTLLEAADGQIGGPSSIGAAAETVFEAASIGKLVIAVSVMQLVDDGKLDLDADVSTILGFPVRNPKHARVAITLRLLLTHRASIVDRQDELLAPRSAAALGDFIRHYLVSDGAPRAEIYDGGAPGEVFRYSNIGAALAAYVVERAAGASFDQVTATRIFGPLAMRDTRWGAGDASATPTKTARLAIPHEYVDGGFTALPHASHAIYPVVDLYSSARDLARFGRAILRGGELDGVRVLAEPRVRTMVAPQSADGEQALAWQLRTIGGRSVVGHEGEDRGATTALFLDLGSGTGALVLANGDAFASGDRMRAGAVQDLLAELLGAARAAPPAPR